MSVSQRLVDFNQLFSSLTKDPIIINDVMESSEEAKENLKDNIYTKYHSDLLSNLPSCNCGDTTGEYESGLECPNCHTIVLPAISQNIEPILWMRSPKGVQKLINPHVWTMLNDRFSKSSFKIIQWICDTTYKLPVKIPLVIDTIQSAGINRGYNNFVTNFSSIMTKLFDMKEFALKNKNERDYLRELIFNNPQCVFSDYLPLVNKTVLIIEETTSGTYIDPIILGAIDAVLTIASIDNSMSQHSVRVKENRTIKTIVSLAEFSDNYTRKGLALKTGIYRKNLYGSRVAFSFRTVITSITDKHDYDEIHIPWGVAVTVFKYPLINRLKQMGYTLLQAQTYLISHAKTYSKLLDDLFQEFIATSPQKGIPVTVGRNPSLQRGSLQLVRITRVFTDPTITITAISILITKSMNADFKIYIKRLLNLVQSKITLKSLDRNIYA